MHPSSSQSYRKPLLLQQVALHPSVGRQAQVPCVLMNDETCSSVADRGHGGLCAGPGGLSLACPRNLSLDKRQAVWDSPAWTLSLEPQDSRGGGQNLSWRSIVCLGVRRVCLVSVGPARWLTIGVWKWWASQERGHSPRRWWADTYSALSWSLQVAALSTTDRQGQKPKLTCSLPPNSYTPLRQVNPLALYL